MIGSRLSAKLERSLATWEPGSTAPDFCEIVKRGANITYCTTSAGDLEALADATQSFDWAIIEEAGKAHGFDLALPSPGEPSLASYLATTSSFRRTASRIIAMVSTLSMMRSRLSKNYLSAPAVCWTLEWIRAWRDRRADERSEFKDYARRWLNTFERVLDYCSLSTGSEKRTIDEADGAAAGILSRQHRMHPTIGDLISTAYYR